MNRREFLRDAAMAVMLARIPLALAQDHSPEIAFTFDDPTTDAGANLTATTMLETRSQLNSLLPILTQEQGKGRA